MDMAYTGPLNGDSGNRRRRTNARMETAVPVQCALRVDSGAVRTGAKEEWLM